MRKSAIHIKDLKTKLFRAARSRAQHKANPLHVYARLRDIGLPKKCAGACTRWYEPFYKAVLG